MNIPLMPPRLLTLADLLEYLGDIAPGRVRYDPRPGTATVADVVALQCHEDRLYELVDGVLVEKVMGFRESLLACALIHRLGQFVKLHRLGLVTGEAGMMRLFAGLVRIPDVAFVSWERIPDKKVPTEPVPELAPDLAVEVLSEGNTQKEMARKREDYFNAGVRLVWEFEPKTRQAFVYTGPTQVTVLNESDTLDGGAVLPGFVLALKDLFAELDQQAP